MKLQMKVLGTKDLDAALSKIVNVVVHPQSGIVDSLQKGAEEIVEDARRRVWEIFDTSGDFPSRIKVRKVNQYRVDVYVDAPYGAVHEYGGTFTVTPLQRAFFWHKFAETGESMWRALALSTTYTIPARPYLRPAIDSKRLSAAKIAAADLATKIKRAL